MRCHEIVFSLVYTWGEDVVAAAAKLKTSSAQAQATCLLLINISTRSGFVCLENCGQCKRRVILVDSLEIVVMSCTYGQFFRYILLLQRRSSSYSINKLFKKRIKRIVSIFCRWTCWRATTWWTRMAARCWPTTLSRWPWVISRIPQKREDILVCRLLDLISYLTLSKDKILPGYHLGKVSVGLLFLCSLVSSLPPVHSRSSQVSVTLIMVLSTSH